MIPHCILFRILFLIWSHYKYPCLFDLLLISLETYLINHSLLSLPTDSFCLICKPNQVSLSFKNTNKQEWLPWPPTPSLSSPLLPYISRRLCPLSLSLPCHCSVSCHLSSLLIILPEKTFPLPWYLPNWPHSIQPPWRIFINDRHSPQSFSFPWEWTLFFLSSLFHLISFSDFSSFLYRLNVYIPSRFHSLSAEEDFLKHSLSLVNFINVHGGINHPYANGANCPSPDSRPYSLALGLD